MYPAVPREITTTAHTCTCTFKITQCKAEAFAKCEKCIFVTAQVCVSTSQKLRVLQLSTPFTSIHELYMTIQLQVIFTIEVKTSLVKNNHAGTRLLNNTEYWP